MSEFEKYRKRMERLEALSGLPMMRDDPARVKARAALEEK